MVETKPFKTKLCVLHQRGRCVRETCTFAHGDSELRGFSSSFNDRRMDNDLRSKFDRKRSPLHSRSSGRDATDLRAYNRSSPVETNKRRKIRTYEHMDGPNDFSGCFTSLNGSVDSKKDTRLVSSNAKMVLEDELKQVQHEVDVLFNRKSQLEIEMEERTQQADSLSSRIKDLETQLSGEKDKSKRVKSKIKKFIRAHIHHSRLQDEIKRSQVRLDQMVGELEMDAVPTKSGEDKMNVNTISDREVLELKDAASPVKKQQHNSVEASQVSKSANTSSGHDGVMVLELKRNSLVHCDGHQEALEGNTKKEIGKPPSETKPQLGNNASEVLDPLDQLKASESNHVSTSMAAHADDEFTELFEEEENPGEVRTSEVETGLSFPLPPLPSVSQNSYFQYEGDDENVDVDGLGEELVEVDIM